VIAPEKERDLVILGDSAFAEVAYEYFTHDSPYRVVGFSVEAAFLKREALFGLPVVPFETIETSFQPEQTSFYAALVYSQLNRLRSRLFATARGKGFRPASYISSRASIWPNAIFGEHCFVFEDNTVQPFVRVGDNVVLWSGNHIGHHSQIGDNCFVSSHVVVSGFCQVGANSFLGVNSTIANNVTIGADNWIGPGVTIMADTAENLLFRAVQSEPAKVGSRRFFKVPGG
jgi:sugar O-acyltransferase (sialic acid O-acetyltransferase NeuD family)